MKNYRAIFARRLRELKEDHDYSWEDLEQGTGISRQNLQNWAKGNAEPKLEGICAVADFFDVSLDYMTKRKDSAAIGDGTGLKNDKASITDVAAFTSLSGFTVNALHFESDPVMRSLYKKLFHTLIGELHSSGEELVNLILAAATARAITNADLNRHRALTGVGRAEETNLSKAIEQTSDGLYTLPAYEVERVYIQDAEAIIHGCVCSVDDLVREISRQFQSADEVKKMKTSIQFEVDEAEEDLEPWFDEELEPSDDFKV